jgi:6-phosphogluconolactonase (cycloisomerase 2 family)
VSVTQNGRYAYVSNFDSSQLTGFQVSDTGRLSPMLPAIFATPVVGNPIDSAIVGNRFFYLLSHFRNQTTVLSAFRINADGSLRPIGQISGLPLSTVGLAAY